MALSYFLKLLFNENFALLHTLFDQIFLTQGLRWLNKLRGLRVLLLFQGLQLSLECLYFLVDYLIALIQSIHYLWIDVRWQAA